MRGGRDARQLFERFHTVGVGERPPWPVMVGLRHKPRSGGTNLNVAALGRHPQHSTPQLSTGGEPMQLLANMTSGGFIGLWAAIYFVLIITLGVMSLRKGHWLMFLVGIFLPFFWLIGAIMPRRVR